MTIHFEIAGFLLPWDRVAYRAMNFGQPVPDRTPFRYALRRPVREFTERLGPKLEQCVIELREDYEKFGDDDDATTIALAAAGWPSAAALHRDHPEVMSLVMRQYLYFDILDAYAPARDYDFVINTVDDVVRDGDDIVTTGTGYERGEGNGPWRA
ncbi:hypothetical protein [Actinoplanes sp. NPDC026623]|uniref:hypothetical protein n=1 Tax=Actinoplanes sp. NPDC026623 TaxID=3155610 RepID=UPI0033EA8AA8